MATHIPPCIPNVTSSGCSKSGYLYIYPYHNSQEIWYDDEMRGFQFWTGGEDPKWSNSLQDFQFYNHRTYYGFRVGRLHKVSLIIFFDF